MTWQEREDRYDVIATGLATVIIVLAFPVFLFVAYCDQQNKHKPAVSSPTQVSKNQ